MAELDEFTNQIPQKDYVAGLTVAHEKLIEDALHAQELAGQTNDLQTQDLMIKRISSHQKTVWMLKSYLK